MLGAQRLARELDPAAAAAAGFLTATSVYLVYWTFGGMETTLVSFTFLLVLIAALRLVRDPTSTRAITSFIVATSLFVVVRPESGFVLVATFGGFLVGWAALRRLSPAPGVPVRAGAILLAVPVIAWGAVTLWRVMYFGAPFPQPVGAKVGGLEAADGLAYAIRWLARPYVLAPLALLALSVIGLWRRADKPTALLWAAFGAQLGFVVLSGGGWMEGGRLLVPILPLAAVLIAVALVRLPRTALLVAAVVALQVVGVVHFAARDSTGTPAWTEPAYPGRGREAAEGFAWYERRNRVHLRDIVFLRSALPELRAIARRAEGPLTISTGQAGMVPYFLLERIDEDVRLIDLGSLTTDAFAACPPEGFRHTPLGSGVGYEYWLSHIDECRLPPPDVVYDVGPFEARTALEDGYTPVLQTPAAVIGSGSARFPGAPVSAEMFLAVRDGLLPNRSGT